MDRTNLSSAQASIKTHESDECLSEDCFAVGGCNGVVILSRDEFSAYCEGLPVLARVALLFTILIGLAVLAVSLAA